MRKKLVEWVENSHLSIAECARRLECSRPHLSMILRGIRMPGRDLAWAIEMFTGLPASGWKTKKRARA